MKLYKLFLDVPRGDAVLIGKLCDYDVNLVAYRLRPDQQIDAIWSQIVILPLSPLTQGLLRVSGTEFFELSNSDITVREYGPDFQFSAHCLYDPSQCAQIHVSSFLHFCNRWLTDMEDFRQLHLSQSARFAQFVQCHIGQDGASLFFRPLDLLGGHFVFDF